MKRRDVMNVLTPDTVAAAYADTKAKPTQHEWYHFEGKQLYACPATVVALFEERTTFKKLHESTDQPRALITNALNVDSSDLFYFSMGVDGDSFPWSLTEEYQALIALGKTVWSAIQT